MYAEAGTKKRPLYCLKPRGLGFRVSGTFKGVWPAPFKHPYLGAEYPSPKKVKLFNDGRII